MCGARGRRTRSVLPSRAPLCAVSPPSAVGCRLADPCAGARAPSWSAGARWVCALPHHAARFPRASHLLPSRRPAVVRFKRCFRELAPGSRAAHGGARARRVGRPAPALAVAAAANVPARSGAVSVPGGRRIERKEAAAGGVRCARAARSASARPTPPLASPFTQDYDRAVAVFERVVSLDPLHAKGWVSWAQAEARRSRREGGAQDHRARAVLQAGLALVHTPAPATAPLLQAWALLELQKGNGRAALALLRRAVAADPTRCAPVLRWAPVAALAARERERREENV